MTILAYRLQEGWSCQSSFGCESWLGKVRVSLEGEWKLASHFYAGRLYALLTDFTETSLSYQEDSSVVTHSDLIHGLTSYVCRETVFLIYYNKTISKFQAGYNKGASQAGLGGFGNTRHIWRQKLIMHVKFINSSNREIIIYTWPTHYGFCFSMFSIIVVVFRILSLWKLIFQVYISLTV